MIREHRLILDSIKKLNLNLSGKIVLTEVGSQNYLFSPIIPALAGAEKVYAWTRNSIYGNANQIIKDSAQFAKEFHVESKISFFDGALNSEHIKVADIITNSGFLRPINNRILQYTKKDVVIPLMFEEWELRPEDIDIVLCTKMGIKVAGTWENHPLLKVFSSVGALSVKLLLESGLEVYQNNILIWSEDEFGIESEKALQNFGAANVYRSTDMVMFNDLLPSLDAVFICNYDEKRVYFNDNELFNAKDIFEVNPSLKVIHLFGKIDVASLNEFNISYYPREEGRSMIMTRTLGHLGPKPLIDLQVASLKVAQYLLEAKSSDLIQPINY